MQIMGWGRRLALASVVVAGMAGVRPIDAQQTRVATLSSAQEVGASLVTSTGSGFGTVTLNAAQTSLFVDLTYRDLLQPATGAHIHRGAFGANGPVAVDFVSNGFQLGLVGGSYVRTLDLTLAATYGGGYLTSFGNNVELARADLVRGFLDGNSYLNIHSSARLAGEIRGQLQVVPEPSTYVLMATGLLTLGLVAGRRQRTHG